MIAPVPQPTSSTLAPGRRPSDATNSSRMRAMPVGIQMTALMTSYPAASSEVDINAVCEECSCSSTRIPIGVDGGPQDARAAALAADGRRDPRRGGSHPRGGRVLGDDDERRRRGGRRLDRIALPVLPEQGRAAARARRTPSRRRRAFTGDAGGALARRAPDAGEWARSFVDLLVEANDSELDRLLYAAAPVAETNSHVVTLVKQLSRRSRPSTSGRFGHGEDARAESPACWLSPRCRWCTRSCFPLPRGRTARLAVAEVVRLVRLGARVRG